MASVITATIEGNAFKIVPLSNQQVEIDGKTHSFDLVKLADGSFSLILDGKSFVVEVLQSTESWHSGDQSARGDVGRSVPLSVNGRRYLVRVDDEHSLLIKSLFTTHQPAKGPRIVRAPMPGLISRIEVQVGETVAAGSGLLVLEAMKMENEIRSLGKGNIQTIHVLKGDAVEKGEPLVTIIEH